MLGQNLKTIYKFLISFWLYSRFRSKILCRIKIFNIKIFIFPLITIMIEFFGISYFDCLLNHSILILNINIIIIKSVCLWLF